MNSKYKLKVIGKNPKRFISELINQKVSLYYMENHDKYSIIIVDEEGYKFINNKKTSYKVSIVKLYGFVKYKNMLKDYSIFLLSLMMGIILIIILSNIIFDIKIEHPKSEIRELIKNDLEEFGIEKYHFKVSYEEKEAIKRKILNKEVNRIEWIEIEEIGTKYIIKVEERIKNEIKKDNKAQNIIAKKDAMITNIYATHGEVKKKKHDYVKKGEVLISGIINKDDKPITKTKAMGEVFGEVWYKVKVELPKKYKDIDKTGKSEKRIEVNLFNKSIFILPIKYKSYQTKRTTLIKNKIIPISVNYTLVEEININKKEYTINNINKDAINIAIEKLKLKLGSKDSIIYKKVLKKNEKNSKILVEVFLKVKEDITEVENIENVNIEELKEGDIVESDD